MGQNDIPSRIIYTERRDECEESTGITPSLDTFSLQPSHFPSLLLKSTYFEVAHSNTTHNSHHHPYRHVSSQIEQIYVFANTSTSMEEAINDAIHTTVGTFVDKAATGAMENASAETSDRAAEERVKSAEKQVKILEEKVKALEEKLKVAEDNFTTAIDNAVQEKVKEVEELMQSKIQRATRMAKLQAQIDLVSNSSKYLNKRY